MRVATVLPIGLLCLLTIACGPSSGEDVLIEVNDEVTLACTLLIPGGDAPLPVVILIPGGGPHTRDVDVFGFQLFRETARHLHSHGIASLRCDKRGIGRSVGGSAPGEDTTFDFADDALAQVAYIETRPEFEPGKIGLLGMSEGATVATMVDAESDSVEFVILAAASVVPPRQFAHDHTAASLRRQGMDEDAIAARIELWDRIFDAIERDEPTWQLREELRSELLADAERASAAWRERIGDVEGHVDRIVSRSFNATMSKWGRSLLAYEPREVLLRMDSRVLALYGSKDQQVPAERNASVLEVIFQEAGKTNYEIRILEDANHMFQKAVTGRVAEYSELPKEFIPGYLEAITAWVLDRPFEPGP